MNLTPDGRLALILAAITVGFSILGWLIRKIINDGEGRIARLETVVTNLMTVVATLAEGQARHEGWHAALDHADL